MLGKKSDKKLCPMFKKPCITYDCAWYIHIRGQHPQTGQDIDQHDCSMVMQPLLIIENSAQQRATGAAVESFRNEMVKSNEASQKLLAETARQGKRTLSHYKSGPNGEAVPVYMENQ